MRRSRRSFLFPLLAFRSSVEEIEVSLRIMLQRNHTVFETGKKERGGKKNCKITEYRVGSWTGIVELHLTWGGESLENLFVALFRVRGFLDGHTRVYNVFPLSRNR